MSKDILLDRHIRVWVFVPILLLTLLVEIVRHYSIIFCNNRIRLTAEEIQSLEMKKRIQLLLKNFKYIPKPGFEMRKESFSPETGFLKDKIRPVKQKEIIPPFTLDKQEKYLSLIKGHLSNHFPMIVAGTWVSYIFSGFLCTKVPFPLTFAFKSMLQRNIDLAYLDPSWVSSCSWYFLNVFGLRNLLGMFFNKRTESELMDMEAVEGVKVSFREDFNNLAMTFHDHDLKCIQYE